MPRRVATAPSGATIFHSVWNPSSVSWSCPRPWKTYLALGLAVGDDIDALAVDLRNQRLLLSTTSAVLDPLLFVYYDVPFHAYQDKIISFAVLAYVGLFYAAFCQREVRFIALFVLYLTVAGLSLVNLSEDLVQVMSPGQTTLPYWLQTGMFALLAIFMNAAEHLDKKRLQD